MLSIVGGGPARADVVGRAVLSGIFAEEPSGLGEVVPGDVARLGVGDVVKPSEEVDLVFFLDVGAGGFGELVGRDPGSGSDFAGAVVGGFEEQAGGPWSGAAASDVEGVEEASVVGCEEGAGSKDAAVAAGDDVVGVRPVVGADEGYEECPGWFSFGGEDAVELVGAAADIKGEAVEDAVSSCSLGAPESLCELRQVGHWPVPFWGHGGRSVVALAGPAGGFCWSWWPGGGGASPGRGGRAPGTASSHTSPIVPVTYDKYSCCEMRGGRDDDSA